jgi:hypothetical protein
MLPRRWGPRRGTQLALRAATDLVTNRSTGAHLACADTQTAGAHRIWSIDKDGCQLLRDPRGTVCSGSARTGGSAWVGHAGVPTLSFTKSASFRALPAATSRGVTFRGNGQPAQGSRGGAPAGAHLTGLSPTGTKARSQRCSNDGTQDAHGERRITAEVRYALYRWRDLLVWECWPGPGAVRALCTARAA